MTPEWKDALSSIKKNPRSELGSLRSELGPLRSELGPTATYGQT